MSSEGVTPPTGVAAEWALERFLACMKLDVSQQVSFLGEGYATLAALEWTITCMQEKWKNEECMKEKCSIILNCSPRLPHSTIRYDKIRYSVSLYNITRYDTIQHVTVQYNTIR